MSAIEDITKWAEDLPDWQADAVRRLLEQGELTNDDRDEIYQMVKVAAGIQAGGIEPVLPKIGAFSGTGATLQPIALQRISEIQHVNAVENDSTIPFGHQGITVIYGENGSGKSSYARVLKRACRARDTKESILPNIFDSDEEGPATATIKIAEGATKDIELPWTDGGDSDERLASIAFFDSKCARLIVDENNEATYIPYGCEAFNSLVGLVKYVKVRLQGEKPTPIEPTGIDVVAGTDAEAFLKKLNRNTKPADIDSATKWTKSHDTKLTEFTARIAQSDTAKLIKEAQRLESTAKRTGELADAIAIAIIGLSKDVVSKINSQLGEIKAAEKAVKIAAQASLQYEPLPSGTSNEWRLLYEAAKEYSSKVAYQDSGFPALGPGKLCVLCQQELVEEAHNRLQRFRNFMEDKSEQTYQSAQNKLRKITDEIIALKIPKSGDYGNVLDELSTEERKAVEHTLELLEKERNRLKGVEPGDEELTPGNDFPDNNKTLADLRTKLEDAGANAKKDTDPEALKAMARSCDELASRKILNHIEKEIRTYVDQKKDEFKYDQIIHGLNTRSISEKSKEIISAGLSPQLQRDLANELKGLCADHLPLAVNITGREGGARHQLTLNAARRAKPSDILSEGELSVVAIAGFMAELGGAPGQSPIVFDDPVSSLDHQYSRHIARRLVDEAKRRQVIVFTHNIAFLVETRKHCAGIPLTVQTVKRFGGTPGRCMEALPWEAMPVKDRLSVLDRTVNEISQYRGKDDVKYNKEAASVYGLLRETWEAFIEQDLLNDTVRRHDIDVRTQQLVRVEIRDEDCKRIDEGMSKCSEWMTGHDKSQALSVNRPSPNEIRDDIRILRAFREEINDRHNEVRKRRKAVLKPQATELG